MDISVRTVGIPYQLCPGKSERNIYPVFVLGQVLRVIGGVRGFEKIVTRLRPTLTFLVSSLGYRITTPQGRAPTAMVFTTRSRAVSITETEFDSPFAT